MSRTSHLSRVRTLAASTAMACLGAIAVAPDAGAADNALRLGRTHLSGWIVDTLVVGIGADGTQ